MKQRHYLLILIGIVYLAGYLIQGRWKETLYYGDSNYYYLHVVSFFVNQDVGDYDKTITTLREVNPGSVDPREDRFGIRLTEKGRRYIKYTLGVPVMETPFFLLAHAYAKLTGAYEANGWTRPYLFLVGLSTIFYLLVGFYLLMRVLEKHFSKRTVALVVLTLLLATNLFYHATFVTMAHGFLFFDYCLLIYLTEKFHERPNWKRALAIGGVVGLIALTRVPEVISAFIPILWGVVSWGSFNQRIRFFLQNFRYLIFAGIGFLAVFSVQFAYWYYVSGKLVFNPYQGEGFNFLEPHIFEAWFHFSNGWLIYTPVMALSLIGLFFLRKYFPSPLIAIIVFVGLNAYIHYSYYVWTYFPGFGQRPMVETYPLLAFGLAAFYLFCYEKQWLRWLPITAIAVFGLLNLFQTWQMREGVIWTERGNRAFYIETFGTLTPTLNSLRSYDTRTLQPDSSAVIFVKNLVSESFDDSTRFSVTPELKYNGRFSLFSEEEFVTLREGIPLDEVRGEDWLRISIQAYMRGVHKVWNRDVCQSLVAEIYDENGDRKKFSSIKPSTHIGNTDFNIWTTGEVDQWGEGSFFVRVPAKAGPGWSLKVFMYNPFGQKLYLDDFRVDHYRKQEY